MPFFKISCEIELSKQYFTNCDFCVILYLSAANKNFYFVTSSYSQLDKPNLYQQL